MSDFEKGIYIGGYGGFPSSGASRAVIDGAEFARHNRRMAEIHKQQMETIYKPYVPNPLSRRADPELDLFQREMLRINEEREQRERNESLATFGKVVGGSFAAIVVVGFVFDTVTKGVELVNDNIVKPVTSIYQKITGQADNAPRNIPVTSIDQKQPPLAAPPTIALTDIEPQHKIIEEPQELLPLQQIDISPNSESNRVDLRRRWQWNPERDAPKAYEAHVVGFMQETGKSLAMPWQEAERVSHNLTSTLLSAPLDTPRYAFASKTSSGETITIASAPVAQNGSVSSIGCISSNGQITNFGRTTTSHTEEGKLVYEFSRQVFVSSGGREIDISPQAVHMGDCKRALSLLKQNHDLPELGSPFIQ